MKRKIVITTGDPAGCGPLITLKAVQSLKKGNLFVVSDRKILKRYRLFNKLSGKITFIDVKTPHIDSIRPGYPSRLSGAAAMNYLETALILMKREKIQRLVTAPLSKEAVRASMGDFSGHTEFLAGHFKAKGAGMMMVGGNLRIFLLTRHIPLRDVSGTVRKKLVRESLLLVYHSLRSVFRIRNPKIVFAGLNPHAGVNTFLEKEERIIRDIVKDFKHGVEGPYPSDTLFLENIAKKYDCIIACYHDQAMIPFKLLSFTKGVNLTLGLPIIRTSPAHGTAFDLMRKNIEPLHSSMVSAIKLARKLSL